MFRITFIVEDKNLPKVLHAITGLVLNMEPPQPVTNAVVVKPAKAPAKVEQASTATSIKGRLVEYLGTIKGSRISTVEMRDKWVEYGGAPGSLNGSLLIQLKEENRIRSISRGFYTAL